MSTLKVPFESIGRKRAEVPAFVWMSEASRALERGDYADAIAILVDVGHDELAAERFVVISLALNTPLPIREPHVRLLALVDVARHAMEARDWSFASVADAVDRAQRGET